MSRDALRPRLADWGYLRAASRGPSSVQDAMRRNPEWLSRWIPGETAK